MNPVDIAILVILAAFLLKGLLRGLLKGLCSLVGLLAGGFLAFRYHPPLAEMLMEGSGWPAMICVTAAFLILFLSTVLFFSLLGFLLSRFVKLLFLGGLNRVAGGFFGIIEGILLLAVVLFALSRGPLPEGLEPLLDESTLAPPFIHLGESAFHGSRDAFTRVR